MIGRIKELKLLSNACESNKSELISVYGRRRIGKTYLINYMFKEHRKECLFFRFTGSYLLDSNTQRENFIESIYDWFGVEPTKEINSWMNAFNFLKRTIDSEFKNKKVNEKVVIFLDEVPWIDKKNTNGFLGALGHFWNDYCEIKENVILIICGSNSSWIKNKIFEDTQGPLYQRLTHKIHLKPFTLKETASYLIDEKNFDIDSKTIFEVYMVFGGVAKYLSFLNPKLSLSENIDNLFFNIDGHLYKEYDDIFKSLFQDKSKFYTSIIQYLCTKQSGFTQTQIASGLDISMGAKLKDGINDLIECGFIQGLSKYNQKTNAKYIISDPYCLFHNKWVKEHSKNDIANLSKPYWTSIQSSSQYSIWTGFIFEIVCLTNIEMYLDARNTKGLSKSHSYWNFVSSNENEKGAQIDILVEYQNNVYDIVECKFYNDEFVISKDYKDNLQNKLSMFKKYGLKGKYEIKLIMLTTYGCKHNSHYNSLNIADDITIDDLLFRY
ncbi:MAG: ATP-binding protein [Poseidonibacter sp.]|uniref:AAA family ATPase n=1 Tax=Poseidonibacter sp. TaxID=2321188 RepID=UPI00359D21F2